MLTQSPDRTTVFTIVLVETPLFALYDIVDFGVLYAEGLIARIRNYRRVNDADSLRQLQLVT